MNSNQKIRARFILGGIIVIACSLITALYSLQITHGANYIAKANKQYIRVNTNLFDRGTIFFSGKDDTRPAAATLTSTYIISVNPKLIIDGLGIYEALSQYIKIDKDSFIAKTQLVDDPYEEVARKVDDATAQSIRALALRGVTVTKETRRSYPGNEIATHVVGITGESQSRSIEGKYGLERYYNDVLQRPDINKGGSTFTQLFTDAYSFVAGNTENQGDIVTTIEPTVQTYLEKILHKTSTTWNPDEIGGIVIDPKTGEIIAAAALPNFNPNDLSKVKNTAVLSNPLVENVYEMGSILKAITIATGLDTDAITPSSVFDDTGTMTLNSKKISNFDGRARGKVVPQEILAQSLNIGTALIALKIGKEDLVDYFTRFGLGKKTGVDQPNEATGILSNLKQGREIEMATAAYGQGIATSPIAMVRALAVLANGGNLITPYFVKEIDYVDGTKKMIDRGSGVRVLKEKSSQETTRMLVYVVDTALRKGALKMDNYTVAAKTGTAQVPDLVNKKYYEDRYLHSFFGYFPAYDAQFLVFLYQRYPKGAQYASETLAEPFHDMTKFLISYYNIPPDR